VKHCAIFYLVASERHETHREPRRGTPLNPSWMQFSGLGTSGNGEFAESEVWLFSAETLALVAALVEARIEGLYPELEWWG
jgi:hypothetical protein